MLRALVEHTAGITADTGIAAATGIDVTSVRRNEAGVVLHTGPASYPLGPGIVACPVAVAWAEEDPEALVTRS